MILSAQDLHFQYGPIKALRGINFKVEKSGIVALLGPNGAGKSTLSRLIAGVQRPTSGQLQILDRKDIGVTPQEIDFPKHLTVGEVLKLVSAHYKNSQNLEDLLQEFNLVDVRTRWTSQLSGGQKRRLAVACTFAGHPKLAVLDEPTTGLDVESRRILWKSICDFSAKGGTVLLTTHYMDEVESLAERVIVIDKGQILFDGGIEDMKGHIGYKEIRFRSKNFNGILGTQVFSLENNEFSLNCVNSDDVIKTLLASGIDFHDLRIHSVSLEDAFLEMLKKSQITP